MRKRSYLTKKIQKSADYEKTTKDGLIIYVDPTFSWCNVRLPSGTILYRVKFSEGVNLRLKRLEQHVTLMQTVGKKYGYIIIGGGRRYPGVSDFIDLGAFIWGDGTLWGDKHQWG